MPCQKSRAQKIATRARRVLRLYTFLSQIFDYGTTDIEKRAIFYKALLPLLELGRERTTIDLSKVMLTHHQLKSKGVVALSLSQGEAPKLAPITESGGGSVHENRRRCST